MIGKKEKKQLRHLKIRKKIAGSTIQPRLSVFRSNKHTYAQIIDDEIGKTIVSVSDVGIKTNGKVQKSQEIGTSLAALALKKNIKKVVFDRSGYKYHGRVKAIAEGARKGGLIF
jgi:large subunit ribosomal protein L18